jgi:signal transduction histidine kinase
LAFVLLIAMMLVNLVSLLLNQENLIQKEIDQAKLLLNAVQQRSVSYFSERKEVWDPEDQGFFDGLFTSAGSSNAIVLDPDKRQVYTYGSPRHELLLQVKKYVGQSMADGQVSIRLAGSTKGVFWRQKEVLILAGPIRYKGETIAGTGILMPLTPVYKVLRRTQHIVLTYTVINLMILAAFGLYRMNALSVRPIRRLVARAETFRETDDDLFSIEKDDNEFSQLSKSLNRMLLRLSDNREELKASVVSLENANRKLAETQKEMVQTEKLASVGRLSAGIAHEIGNPIGIIQGYLDLLKDPHTQDEDRREYLARTESEIDRVSSIIRQLLNLSRPVGNRYSMVSVHQVIGDITDMCRYQPMFSKIDVDLELKAENDGVLADADQLRQVFLNLMINAADAMTVSGDSIGGQLIIQTRISDSEKEFGPAESRWIRIAFIDNGPGVPESLLSDIFDPFFTTKDPGKGTGLGLSVSYMLIESMGGRIRAENQSGRGLSLVIHLPLESDRKIVVDSQERAQTGY